MDTDNDEKAPNIEVHDEKMFSEDFSTDFENGWKNENINQPPINSQQPLLNNRENPSTRGKGSSRIKTGSGNNNKNPHSQVNLQQQLELWVETKTSDEKCYYYHSITRETTWIRPIGPNIKIMTQLEFETYSKQQMITPLEQQNKPDLLKDSKLSMMPPNLMDPTQMPPGHIPPFVPPFNANISPFGMHAPPHFNTPWNNPQWQSHAPPNDPVKMFDKMIDSKVLASANEWTEHRAPDGRLYYFSSARGESIWERPQALKELDEARASMMHHHHHHPPNILTSLTVTQGSITFDSSGSMIKAVGGLTNKQFEMDANEKERRKKDEIEKAKQQAVKQQPLDKSRPISSTPIAGTPWCIVWTGDSRVFFYNPSTRTSVWERPHDLAGRADVDKAVAAAPEQLLLNSGEKGEKEKEIQKEEQQVSETNAGKTKNDSEKSAEDEDDEEDEDEEIPAKKSKLEEQALSIHVKIQNAPAVPEKKIDVIKDPAAEAELKAAKERAMVPLETRVKQFKEMLKEKEVSAFSTWEKELHKIVFDPRYLLLASKERKQVFEKYVKDRAEDERREKRHKMQKKRDEFRTLMEEANLHSRSNFSDFCSKYSRDIRYKGIEKMRERENLFTDFLSELRRKEKDEKHKKNEQIRKDFFDLLREHNEIDRHTHWMDIKKKLDQDSRYKAINDSILREDYFYEYIKVLKEERKKEKSKKSKKSEKKEKKKKSKDKDRIKDSSSLSTTVLDVNVDEQEKYEEFSERKHDKGKQIEEDNKSEIDEEKSGSDTEKDQEDGEHSGTDSETEKIRKERDRQLRAEASIKEREKEVQKTLAEHLRDRNKEREHHKHDEAVRNFSALLADLVRNPDLTWKEVKKLLKKDHRWDIVEDLDREERERLFAEHIHLLTKKKRDKFREMLDEINTLELTSSWKDIKRQIRDDPRYDKFGNSDRCEREFKEYLKDKSTSAKLAFKELLQECKLITHKSYDTYKENFNHIKEIEDILKNDKRYLVLDHTPKERTEMIIYYFGELKKKGLPAPITQITHNESNRRKK